MLDLFFLTDGQDYINLRSKYAGVFLQTWLPAIKEPKGGGVFQESPITDGRVLVARPFANAIEQLGLMIGNGGQDTTIEAVQTIRRLLQKAVNYSLTEWQTEPVWIEVRARNETNIRYALVLDYRAPGENNPFAEPFDADYPLVTNFPLVLERSDWLANPPGSYDCLPVETLIDIGQEATYGPTEITDDAYVNASFIFLNSDLFVGNQLSNNLRTGIRFQDVQVPQGSTILSAILRLTVTATPFGSVCNVRIHAEDEDDAAAFSTLVDFTGRAETTAFVDWDNLSAAWVAGERVSTPDVSAPVQEVINRLGWSSGNALVIFLDDNASSIDAYRRFASFGNVDYLAPVLEITFSDGNVIETAGQEFTCANANFIGNRRSGVLTHIFYFDDSAATFSSNLLTETLPFNLLPATPAVDDLIYFISETNNPLSAPIGGVVTDLLTAMSGVTGVMEYYNGSWNTLPTAYTPDFSSAPFQSQGINSLHARHQSDTTPPTVNSITGWAIRFRVTSVASPESPVVQNRYPYALGWNEISLSEDDLGGDLPPLLNILLYNRSDDTGALLPVNIAANRVIMGSRSIRRGDLFTSVINLGDLQNPAGVTVDDGLNTTFEDDPQAPTGRVAFFDPVGTSIATRVTVTFDEALSQHYKGVFKPFVRVKQVGGVAGDMGVRLSIGLYSASNTIYTSDLLFTTTIDEIEVFEFREVTLPPNLDIIKANEAIAGLVFSLAGINSNVTPPDLAFIDLYLMPIDEFSFDTADTLQSVDSIFGNPDGNNRILEMDSALRLKRQASSLLLLEQGAIPLLNYSINTNGPLALQLSGDQKMHFLFARVNAGNGWDSYPENAVSVQIRLQKRYFSMRGNR